MLPAMFYGSTISSVLFENEQLNFAPELLCLLYGFVGGSITHYNDYQFVQNGCCVDGLFKLQTPFNQSPYAGLFVEDRNYN
jgi:hypothetical protein